MSLGRQVKSIYTATNLMFVFILYCVLEMGLLKQNIDVKVYGIMLIGVYFMQYLNEAKFSKHEISKENLDRMSAMYSRIKNDKSN